MRESIQAFLNEAFGSGLASSDIRDLIKFVNERGPGEDAQLNVTHMRESENMDKNNMILVEMDKNINWYHWICRRKIDDMIVYFDPFPITNYVYDHKKGQRHAPNLNIEHFGNFLQPGSSSMCGLWCIYYLFIDPKLTNFYKGTKEEAINNDINLLNNDQGLLTYFESILNDML